jgi:hypothetical protein
MKRKRGRGVGLQRHGAGFIPSPCVNLQCRKGAMKPRSLQGIRRLGPRVTSDCRSRQASLHIDSLAGS